MKRDSVPEPVSRRSGGALLALPPLLLTLIATFLAFFAPSCGGERAAPVGGHALQKLEVPEQGPVESSSKTFAVLDLQEPLVTTSETTEEEDAAIHAAADAFHALEATPKDDESQNLVPFEQFAVAYPNSGWTSGVYLNLGLKYFHTGYLSKAFPAFQSAFELGKGATDWKAKLPVDRAFGELVRMHARVGHVSELEALFRELGDRPIAGSATELVAGAREGLSAMHTEPGIAFLCGPAALGNVMRALGSTIDALQPITDARSGEHGFTLAQVADLADQVGLSYRLIYRAPGQAVPVPSVMNWNVHHYGAIVSHDAGLYLVQDPTFGGGMLSIPAAAIDAEASGFFLVPDSIPQDAGWRDATPEEANAAYGMGLTLQGYEGAVTPVAGKVHKNGCPGCPSTTRNILEAMPDEDPMGPQQPGLPVADAHTMMVSLNINDTPVGYAPQVGPPAFVSVTYNQRESLQPATFTYTNIGPKWTLSTTMYIQDYPSAYNNGAWRYYSGGGYYYQPGSSYYNSSTGVFTEDQNTAAQLVRTPATGTLSYLTLNKADGSVYKYAQLDGATTYPRNVFISTITDPQGNVMTFNYTTVSSGSCPGGACTLLSSITDAAGRNTTFTYGVSGQPLMVSRITDPFGRHADFTYDGSGRLSTITDVLGITSTMGYDGSGLVNSLQTPYGTTSFSYGQTLDGSGNVQSRYLNTTDPLSQTERLEFYQLASGVSGSDSATPCCVSIYNAALNYRNSYFWDKNVYPTYGTGSGKDYNKAKIWHFLHEYISWPSNETSPMVESTKEPLENRVWYRSPYQPNAFQDGGLYVVSAAARVSDNTALGTTQLAQATRNDLGRVTQYQDPYSRYSGYTYASNLIDLTQIKQYISGTWTVIGQYTYNSVHEPLTYVDAAGKTWRYCYNSLGQLTQAIDPANYVSGSACGSYGSVGTRYTYESSAPYRLTSITNPAGNTQASFTYPSSCSSSGLVNCDLPTSITDSEGRTVSYTRDAFDRVTTTTYPDSTTDVDDYTFQSGTYSGTQSLEVRKHTDRLALNTVYDYDANRLLTQVTDPSSHTVQYAYFANGKLNTLTDQNGHATTWAIDIQGRPTSKTFADGKTITYAYSANEGLLHTVTDATSPTAQVKTYSYGYDDRLTGIAYTNAVNTISNVTFTWDTSNWPRITSMADGNGTTSYSYVALGTNGALKLLTEDGPYSNDAMTWAYDTDGRPNSLTVGGLAAETWSYDALSRATSHVTSLGTWTYTFNGQTGAPTSRTLGSTGISTTWAYDTNTNDRRLTGITNAATGASPGPRSYTFGYTSGMTTNPYDILSSTQSSGGNGSWVSQNWTYTYSNLDRLTNATGSIVGAYSYAYDYAGNPTTWTAVGGGSTSSPTYSNINELTSGSYTYDLVGEETADGTRSFKYDAENRVVEIDYTGTSHWSKFVYDGIGRRTQTQYYNGATTTTRRYAWCGSMPCEERDGSDTILKRFYPEGEYTISGTVKRVYMPDQVGSVRDVVNVSGPSVDYSQDFTPYGGVANSSGSTAPFFGYAGMVYDPNSSLNYSATRFYDPAQGRWIHRDFIEEAGGLDLFSYADGNPISNTDESGLAAAPLGVLGNALRGFLPRLLGPGATILGVTVTAKEGADALARDSKSPEKTYQTYMRYNPDTGQTYVGRTSGTGSPQANLDNRYRSKDELALKGFSAPRLDESSNSYCAIRGREQDLIDAYGGIGSAQLANKRNGIWDLNPLYHVYTMKSHAEFGPALPR